MKIQTYQKPISLQNCVQENESRALHSTSIIKNSGISPQASQTFQVRECIDLLQRVEFLEKKLTRLEKKLKKTQQEQRMLKKRRRRNLQLSKRYKCLNQNCQRVYESVTSLKFHMKTKHQTKIKKKRLQDIIIQVK